MRMLRYLPVLASASLLFGAYTYYWSEVWGSTISGNSGSAVLILYKVVERSLYRVDGDDRALPRRR